MKISKTAVLVLGGIFATLGLGLMVVNAAEKTLTMDLKNAVQHFKTVRLITTSDNSGVELNRIDGPLVEISGANNFIITTGGTEESQINQILNVRNSSILGGKGNKINNGGGGGNYDVILGGEGNLMDGSDKNFYNVILGGKGNQIHNSRHSVILGGEGNIINSNSSYDTAIGNKNTLGGSYSVAIGYKNTLSSSYSAAVGSNGTVGGTRSFLWTNDTLSVGEGDVFVVNGENGMVVNANKAHSFAKLTVGGSLVIGTKDVSAGEGGMIKVLNGTNGRKCFCSHNGSGRNSLHGEGSCVPICNGTQINPKCAATADVTCNGKVFNVENGCEIGSVVAGTGAFFIDNGNYIHWACESENGNVTTSLNPSVDCKQKIPDGQCGSSKTEAVCGGERGTCTKGDLYTEITKPADENYWYWYCKYGAEGIKECKATKQKRSQNCTAPSLAAGSWEWVNNHFTQVNENGVWTPASKSAIYSTDTSVECSFKCKTSNGYTWNGSNCVLSTYTCGGTKPSGTKYTLGTTSYTYGYTPSSWTRVNDTATVGACQYKCNTSAGYSWNGSDCVLGTYTCGGTKPTGTKYTLGTTTYTYGYTPTSWTRVGDTATVGACQYKCNTSAGYGWNGSDCVLISCGGTKPTGNGYIFTLKNPVSVADMKDWTHMADGTSQSSLNACEYTCDLNNSYYYNSSICKYKNDWCNNDNLNGCQSPATPKNTNSSDSTKYTWDCAINGVIMESGCFKCKDGYTLHNGACVKKYTVSFSSAYGSMSSQEFIGGVSQNLKQNEFVRPGYSFRGWTSRSSSRDSVTASVNYTDKQYITVNSNMTLYALWEKEETVSCTSEGLYDTYFSNDCYIQKTVGDKTCYKKGCDTGYECYVYNQTIPTGVGSYVVAYGGGIACVKEIEGGTRTYEPGGCPNTYTDPCPSDSPAGTSCTAQQKANIAKCCVQKNGIATQYVCK